MDYRDKLIKLIEKHHQTRYKFSRVSSWSESDLSKLANHQRGLRVDQYENLLNQLGYELIIVPKEQEELSKLEKACVFAFYVIRSLGGK